MKLWVVGARGMLGRCVAEQAHAHGLSVVETDSEVDIGDLDAVSKFGSSEHPTHIFNCAAYTRVDDAETEREAARRVNAIGPGNLALVAHELGSALLHVSTDYVFDGVAEQPYTEAAQCGPQGVYGATKWEGGQLVQKHLAAPGKAFIVRTSWLFGEYGANFVQTMLTLFETKEELRVVADQVGRPTYAPDLADAGLRLLGLHREQGESAPAGTYHFANTGATSWHGFASASREQALARKLPVRTERIVPITTAEFPRPARRPNYSVLATERIQQALGRAPRPWQDALAVYLDNYREMVKHS